jgi:hypothetical protein
MKKILTICLVFCACSILRAQSVSITPADSIFVSIADSSEYGTINAVIFLHNNLTDSMTVKWRLQSDTVPTGWTILFCDNQNCYNLPTAPKTSFAFGPGDSISMHAEFSPACIAGSGTMRISADVVAGPNDTTVTNLVLTYQTSITNACATGINHIPANQDIAVYPNPASNQVSVSGLTYGHNISVQLIDLQGRVINSENKTAAETVSVNVSSLPSGLYLLKLIDLQTNQATVKKLTKF